MMQDKAPDNAADLPLYQVQDPTELGRNMLRLVEEGGRVWAELVSRSSNGGNPFPTVGDIGEAGRAFGELSQIWLQDPTRLAEAQGKLAAGYIEIWNNTLRHALGTPTKPVAEPEPGDNRFKDPEWSSNAYFDFWKQSYLLTAHTLEEMIKGAEGLDDRTRQKAEFFVKQLSSALSPSNFPTTNPEVVRETFNTNAANLVEGMRHLLADFERSSNVLQISQTDTSAFEVGHNLAVTPGKIVFQNDVLQLIQYTPTTKEVREVPLLIVPPWINKFYILDLTQPKSFIKFAVDQGFTVFVVSWVNPDARLAEKTFEDYMREGILSAADAVTRETGMKQINVLGYCVGGTLLASTLAWLAKRGEEPFRSATFLTTQVDFSNAGDLALFINDAQLKYLEEMMAERGFLDGSMMASVFNMLRPRDLIWPYIVNNYLLGKRPMPFDLLYWNQDSTRLPAANHSFYLREFYNENKLAKGTMKLAGIKLDLSKVKLPVFHLATREDHIAPARSVYKGACLLGGPVEFVLAGSGHIAGVVNPPDDKRVKYQHWTNTHLDKSLDDWLATAKETPGSWWPHWAKWLSGYSGEWIAARKPGEVLGTIEDAPGSYVKVKN
jgi:polyhydroxyalkanoate synthase